MKTLQELLKRSALLWLSTLLVFGLGIGALQAQTTFSAQMADGVVQLSEDVPLAFQYQLDIKDMVFSTELEAVDFFTSHNTQLVSFLVNFGQKTVEIHIELRMQPSWTITDWNTYLFEIMKE